MINTTWDKERGIIFRRCEGDVSFGDLVHCTKEGPKHPEFDAYPSTIWVFDKVNFSGDPERMSRQMPFVRDLTEQTGSGRKIAWVTSSPFARALLKEFFHNNQWSSSWEVFDTTEAAVSWCTQTSR